MGGQVIAACHRQFGWRELEQRIGAYACDQGLPAGASARLSHAVIQMCAEAADSVDRDELEDRAMDEAQTLLATWRANRREHRPLARA